MAHKTIRVEFVVHPLPHEVCPECHGMLFEENRQLGLALPLPNSLFWEARRGWLRRKCRHGRGGLGLQESDYPGFVYTMSKK
jgi:hypothetical protein